MANTLRRGTLSPGVAHNDPVLHVIALVLQLGGTLLAVAALVAEWRAARSARSPEPLPSPKLTKKNPWSGGRIIGPFMHMSDSLNDDRIIRQGLRQQAQDADTMELLREQAVRDWENQQRLNQGLLEAYQRLLTEQREADAAEIRATRRRVVLELLGLALVALGTALPDLVDAATAIADRITG